MKKAVRLVFLFTFILILSATGTLSAKPKNRPFKPREPVSENTEDFEKNKNSEEFPSFEEVQPQTESISEPEETPKSEDLQESQEIITDEVVSEEETNVEPVLKERPWYIYKKTAKKIAAGPFENVEQAIEAWLMNPKFKPKKGFFIGRDGVLYTDSPDTYYSRKYNRIKKEIEDRENQETFNIENPVTPVAPAPETDAAETENLEEGMSEPEVKDSAISDSTENPVASENSAESSFSVPEFRPQSQTPVFTGNDYQKTYLSDFITKEVFELPDSSFPDLSEDFTDDPNETDVKGVSLLMKAAKEGNDWKIKTLLNAGAYVNARDKDGWTPLMYAVRYQSNLSVLDLLLAKGAEIKTTNNYSLSPLIIAACFNDNPDIIRKLLSYYSPSDKEVQKAFVQLISTQQTDHFALLSKVKLFLEFGLPVNSYYEGKTPLMYACKYCSSTKVIKLLLDKNAAVTVRSTEGKTAFDYAQTNKTLPRDEIYWSLNKR